MSVDNEHAYELLRGLDEEHAEYHMPTGEHRLILDAKNPRTYLPDMLVWVAETVPHVDPEMDVQIRNGSLSATLTPEELMAICQTEEFHRVAAAAEHLAEMKDPADKEFVHYLLEKKRQLNNGGLRDSRDGFFGG